MAVPKKRKVYTRKNVKSPGEGFRGQARNKSSKLRKLQEQSKTYTRESGKIDRSNLWYDDAKKSKLKVKVKPKGKAPTPKPKAKAAQNPWQKKKAPKVTKFKKPAKKSWLQKTMERGAKRGQKLDERRAIRDFNKAKPTPKGHAPKLTKKQLNAAKGTRALQKGLGISKHASKLKNLKGAVKGGIIYGAADWATNQLVDRGSRQLEGRSKMSMKEYRKFKKDREDAMWKVARGKKSKEEFKSEFKKGGTYGTSQGTGTSSSSTGKTKTSDSNKSSKGTSKKKFTARDRMRAKNVEIHGEEAISKLEKSHKDWKATRKAGTLKTKRKKKTRPDTWRDVE